MRTDVIRRDVTPAAADRLHLTGIVAIILSVIFVTLLVLFTDGLATLWPLYLVPIVIAALTHDVPGAVFVTTLCAGIVTLVLPGAQLALASRYGMLAGFVTFLGCGVVVGLQSSRRRRHSCELEDASIYDPETGLLKPSMLHTRLAEEIERGARHGVDVSLVVATINDFETFKTTFGAYKTGLLLEHMADIMRIAVRSSDVVGRYARDSFAIVAPYTGPTEAEIIAERLRGAVAAARFEGDVLQPAARCTVTVSHASAPREATGTDALADLAERRLATPASSGMAMVGGASSPDALLDSGTLT